MKVFIWADPYPVRYGNSMVFAVAESLEDAVKLAAAGRCYSYCEYEKTEHPSRVDLTGVQPTRIIEAPCAEWHQWSE